MPQVTKNLQDAVLTVKDGTGTPESITVALDVGDLVITIHDPIKNIDDREVLSHQRKGAELPCDVRFSAKFVEFIKQTGASDPTLYEALTQTGGAAAWASTTSDSDVYTLTLEFLIVSPTSTEDDELVTIGTFHAETIEFSEGSDYNTISVTGIAYETKPTITKQVKA